MRVFLPLCLFGLLLEPTRALVDFPDAKIDSSKPNLLTAGLPWGNTAGKKKAGICGDGVTDLQTEECDEGKENGEPESVCFTNCTFKPEVKCGEVLIDTTTALEEAQVCRTAEKIVFELDTPTDVVLPNLVFVSGNVEGNQGPNLMTSLSMPNVIAILDRIVFGVESKDTVSIDFPSLLFTAKLEFRRFNQEIGDMKLRSASLPKLISTNFDVELQNLPELSVLVLDSLEFCREDLDLISLPSLVSVSLPSLFHTRDVILKDMEGLVSFDAPKLYSLQGKVDILDVPALKVFSTPQLTLGGDIPNWKVEGNLISPSGPLLELCSLPAFEVNYIQNTICTSCTAAGAQTPECARTDKEKEKSVEKNGGLFDLSGLTYLGSGEKFDLSDILPSSFEGGMLFQQNEKETGGSAFGKKETKKEDGCPNPYPSLQEKKKEKAPVCGNDIVSHVLECFSQSF
uniref:Uncharacterized protein n=1 Tax=Chromera velia CCMP2878 TaxID=1169474 RepID=A0A0G4HII9_9ALVE|eukprot:Cvel_27967.t1-p1 / transcript=Cvel_27967.t1 / gene=Cvel_27967 / organism=Chromera_velia_CCMP2878 / gene_product=hypothetical protein / transcript_product=hypothetical protein / location=Cvel_scaffold3574:525-1889(-) / protein_length=455 / sequence_SO=supercontig / SO=protein_coding / is_pseudo=false